MTSATCTRTARTCELTIAMCGMTAEIFAPTGNNDSDSRCSEGAERGESSVVEKTWEKRTRSQQDRGSHQRRVAKPGHPFPCLERVGSRRSEGKSKATAAGEECPRSTKSEA